MCPRPEALAAAHDELLARVRPLLGLAAGEPVKVASLMEMLHCRLQYGLSVPAGFDPALVEQLATLAADTRAWSNSNPECLRLAAGRLLVEMLDHLAATVNEEPSSKWVQFSGHDSSLLPVLKALRIRENWPPYGAHIELELWEDSAVKGGHEV